MKSFMNKSTIMLMLLVSALFVSGCTWGDREETRPNADLEIQQKTELAMEEANRELGMPAIVNFQDKKTLKWIYELRDQENLVCHAYLVNMMTGEVGQYLGGCIGYGIPYSTQFSNPEKIVANRTFANFDTEKLDEPVRTFVEDCILGRAP